MTSPFSFVHSLKELFAGKLKQFMVDIDDVHGVWLTEIKQEADRMLTSDFSAEPELMPKTPSQKRNNRRKRVSLGYQEETRVKRRFSKGKRSKLRGSCVKPLDLLAEDEGEPQASTSGQVIEQPKRSTRRKKQTQPEVSLEAAAVSDGSAEQVPKEEPEVVEMEMETAVPNTEIDIDADEPQASFSNTTPSPPKVPALKVSVKISSADRRSAELVAELEASPGRNATKIAIAHTPTRAERSSVRHSLKLRYSKAGLRHSMTQDAVRRASRRSILKKKSTRAGNTTCSSNASDNSCMETDGEVENNRELPSVQSDAVEESEAIPETAERKPGNWNERVTRSMAVNSPLLLVSPALTSKFKEGTMGISSGYRNGKRKSSDTQEASSTKKPLPPKKSQSVRPNMRAFLQTVQKNQMLMMTPTTEGRNTGMKSFIKHTTPLRIDAMARERLKLEALRKKQEQEEERMKKMDEEKKRKLEEQKRKRDERLKRVVEARMKEDEEKKKRMEQKMSQTDEKNDKVCIRMAEEKAKKKVAVKRQEEVDQKRRLEEEARLKKIQQAEEEKRQQELVAKRAAEEEDRARKLAEARRALELRREREQEKERQRQAVAERELAEREKALALQRELERAAREKERREKERRELEEKRQLEERRRVSTNMGTYLLGLQNILEQKRFKSPQSYSITPKGGNQPLVKSTNADDYGMDQRSDDSTDDESAPRKPIPSWAEGHNLQQAITRQYFNPPDLHAYFGTCEPPRLENIFYKSKPRYFKRTSSAVWHSPPRHGHY
ncbi:unnamed protein product [Lota lota]